jgi:hypothetical protein
VTPARVSFAACTLLCRGIGSFWKARHQLYILVAQGPGTEQVLGEGMPVAVDVRVPSPGFSEPCLFELWSLGLGAGPGRLALTGTRRQNPALPAGFLRCGWGLQCYSASLQEARED